jgi:hypothetical protein
MQNAPFKRASLSVLDSKLSIASLTWELDAFYSLEFSDIKERQIISLCWPRNWSLLLERLFTTFKFLLKQPIFLKVDPDQPHQNEK